MQMTEPAATPTVYRPSAQVQKAEGPTLEPLLQELRMDGPCYRRHWIGADVVHALRATSAARREPSGGAPGASTLRRARRRGQLAAHRVACVEVVVHLVAIIKGSRADFERVMRDAQPAAQEAGVRPFRAGERARSRRALARGRPLLRRDGAGTRGKSGLERVIFAELHLRQGRRRSPDNFCAKLCGSRRRHHRRQAWRNACSRSGSRTSPYSRREPDVRARGGRRDPEARPGSPAQAGPRLAWPSTAIRRCGAQAAPDEAARVLRLRARPAEQRRARRQRRHPPPRRARSQLPLAARRAAAPRSIMTRGVVYAEPARRPPSKRSRSTRPGRTRCRSASRRAASAISIADVVERAGGE